MKHKINLTDKIWVKWLKRHLNQDRTNRELLTEMLNIGETKIRALVYDHRISTFMMVEMLVKYSKHFPDLDNLNYQNFEELSKDWPPERSKKELWIDRPALDRIPAYAKSAPEDKGWVKQLKKDIAKYGAKQIAYILSIPYSSLEVMCRTQRIVKFKIAERLVKISGGKIAYESLESLPPNWPRDEIKNYKEWQNREMDELNPGDLV